MDILLLLIYSFFVWLVFIKYKWLPWNITSQVIVVTIPIVALAILILCLNVGAPSSSDVRVMNYVVPINPRVAGKVIDVPVEPNKHVKKGDVLFRLDPAPFQIQVRAAEANVSQLKAKLLQANATARNLGEQLKQAVGQRGVATASLTLARKRVEQFQELAKTGAGNRFDLEQAQADVARYQNDLQAAEASVAQAQENLAAKTPAGVQQEVAQALAQLAQAEAQLADAKWQLSESVQYAPADGTVVALALRPGVMTVPFPAFPAMTFIEDEQWVVAFFRQNEVRYIEGGEEAEIALETYPGRIIKCKVDSVIWATAQGQLPISGMLPNTGFGPAPEMRLAVKLNPDVGDTDLFLAPGARGAGAVYTSHFKAIQILRKVFLRVTTKMDWLVLKLH
ncbi:MAG: biotin/lipoyl-binding protein [Steroidobacteraceae bacterium]